MYLLDDGDLTPKASSPYSSAFIPPPDTPPPLLPTSAYEENTQVALCNVDGNGALQQLSLKQHNVVVVHGLRETGSHVPNRLGKILVYLQAFRLVFCKLARLS